MKQVVINGNFFSFEQEETILTLLRRNGIGIPSLCHDDRLPPEAVCRSCLVRIKDNSRLQPACRTVVTEGMEIETSTPEIEAYRRRIFELLLHEYPFSNVKKYPEKEFHKWVNHYGINGRLEDVASPIDVSHPYIQVDMSKCINCYRCVNICDHLQGQFVWHIFNRADETMVVSDSKDLFATSSCVSCGACADTCPTGAIEDKHSIQYGEPEKTVRTVCAYCGVGCETEVGVKEQKITGIHPAANAPVNKGHLCVKGRYAWEYVYAEDRVLQPMIRRTNEWQAVSWEEAISFCAHRLKLVLDEYGADSIGMIGSARATNEENYLIQKFARTVIGTNNVDNCARVCHQPTAKAMNLMLGTGASTNSFDDIEKAATILVAGANSTESHPVVGARIKQMALKGTNLIVIDPRKTELAEYATIHLQLKPGTNIPLFNAMANVIIEENLCDKVFITNRTEGWEVFISFIKHWTPEKAAVICDIPSSLIRKAARLYAGASPSICFHGLGLTEHFQGTQGVMALVNLALLTGNIGKRGAGINPLRGQNNVQGSAAMGCDPSVYTGMASVAKERQRFETLWKTTLPAGKGLNLPEMLDAAAAGTLKAMWITGYDIFFTMSDANYSREAFKQLDCIIVQDMFLNETAKEFAHVFFPVASSFEKDGTFMNAERRIQKLRIVIPPRRDVKTDWEVIRGVAAAMGKSSLFSFSNAGEIWNEIRDAWPAVYGITYERLDKNGVQWPCPTLDHPGTEVLHTESFPTERKKAKLSAIEFIPTSEQVSANFPYILITGRSLYHFNAGTMTYRTPDKIIQHSDFLYVNPYDADALRLTNGDHVRVSSKYGEASLPVCITNSVKKGELFSTFHDNQVFINNLTSSVRDTYVKTPEYKVTAVQIEKITMQKNFVTG